MKKEIPTTKLRNFYELLGLFSTKTQLSIVKDLNRENKYSELIDIYSESKKHFEKYDNIDEQFFGNSKRKTLKESGDEKFKSTTDVTYYLKTCKNVIVANDPKFNFKYINREISTIRTTNAVFDTEHSGKSSGIGGIDFIGWNMNTNIPVLGEIKCGGDQNPFYALIQLLTYCSELSTKNQIVRIKKWNLFEYPLKENVRFYFYIMLADYNLQGVEKKNILECTIELSKKIKQHIKEIEEIVFLRIDKANPKITLV